MLKAQLHIHSKEDLKDEFIKYSARDVIDKAKDLNFDVIAFTFHDKIFYNKEIEDYAKEKNILLIPGVEKTIEGAHILILGLKSLPELKKISDLRKLNGEALIIAPHPFYPRIYALRQRCVKNIELFDAIEYSFFYTNLLNFNKKAKILAEKHNKPIIGTSDVHNINYFDSTYTLIDSEKDIKSIIKAIKNNKIKLVSKPLPFIKIYTLPLKIILRRIYRKLTNHHNYH